MSVCTWVRFQPNGPPPGGHVEEWSVQAPSCHRAAWEGEGAGRSGPAEKTRLSLSASIRQHRAGHSTMLQSQRRIGPWGDLSASVTQNSGTWAEGRMCPLPPIKDPFFPRDVLGVLAPTLAPHNKRNLLCTVSALITPRKTAPDRRRPIGRMKRP
ncbi:hypothetical protein MATL_G00113120 [Megalops atlanticus]|uniref:Uncharacterized protein n=1 Tax=Megalops atlanticus TaxID=7932 RepID=A0A9D3Q237_MEGAT|nr:hypothetical protein MATL_G00113120 [Megalops atlanticus]